MENFSIKTVCFFYADKSICFYPLKIASDWSNISQILCLVRTFDKNTPRISYALMCKTF